MKSAKRHKQDLQAEDLISILHSSYLLQRRGAEHEPLCIFLQRLCRRLLLDNGTILKMIATGSPRWKRIARRPREGPMCPLRCSKRDKRDHVLFRCEKTAHLRRNLPLALLKITNKHRKQKVGYRLPAWTAGGRNTVACSLPRLWKDVQQVPEAIR